MTRDDDDEQKVIYAKITDMHTDTPQIIRVEQYGNQLTISVPGYGIDEADYIVAIDFIKGVPRVFVYNDINSDVATHILMLNDASIDKLRPGARFS